MKKINIIFSFILILVLVLLIMFSNSSFAAEFDWKVAGGNPPGSLETIATQKFCDFVNERSKGQIKLTLYPSFQLGDSMALMEMVQVGEVEVVANTSSWHTNLMKDWIILGFPYLIRDNDHLKRVQQSSWFKDIEKRYYDEFHIKILANNGYRLPRHLLHRSKALTNPEDIIGVKLRKASSKIYVKPWQDFGADVAVIPWAETAIALQTGLAEAMGCPANLIYSQKFYEGAPHISLTGHQRDTFDLFMSGLHWEKLSPELQNIMTSSAEEALTWYSDQMESTWEEDQKLLKEEGVVFHEVNLDAWKAKALEIAEKWEEGGEWPKGLYKKIQDM